MPPHPLNLVRALTAMEEKLARSAGDSVAIEVIPAQDDVWGLASAQQFEELMLALISPLREDSRERTRVSISCDTDTLAEKAHGATLQPGAYARILIRDNGRGLEPGQQSAVFESFL